MKESCFKSDFYTTYVRILKRKYHQLAKTSTGHLALDWRSGPKSNGAFTFFRFKTIRMLSYFDICITDQINIEKVSFAKCLLYVFLSSSVIM